MKFVVVFSALFVAYVQANVAFDRSAIEHSVYPVLNSKAIEFPYAGLEHLGYSIFHNQDIAGQYNFGYETINNKRNEARDALGNVVGSYSYVDANGKLQTVNYRADERGFNVAGTTIPDASSIVANLEPVHETEEVQLAREAHLKAYEDFVAGKYILPVAPELPAVSDVPFVPEVPELRQIDDEPEVALAKKEFLDKYDATVALLKKAESGEYFIPTPASIELPQPVSDEPAVALAKKEHNEYREALKEQYEALEKLPVVSVVPVVRDAGIIPTPIIAVEGQVQEAFIAPVVPEIKSIVSEKSEETLISPVPSVLPVLPPAAYIAPALKSVSPIVAEGKVHEPLIAPTYPSLPLVSSSYIAPALKSVSPIVAEGKVHEPLIAPTYPSLPLVSSSYIAPALKSVSPIIAEGKVHEPLIAPTYPSLPLVSSSYIAPALKSVSPIVAKGQVHEPLIAPGYLPHPSIAIEGKSVEGKSLLYNPLYYPYYPYYPYGYAF